MTKQQQEAHNKFIKALELQDQGISRQEIYKQLEYASLDSLTKLMRKHDYKYSEEHDKYIISNSNTSSSTFSNTKCSTSSNTDSNTSIQPVENHNFLPKTVDIELLNLLETEQETLKKMIEWYKEVNTTNKPSNTFIKVELPASENIMISTRSNKVIWEQFKVFAKKNSVNFKMGDLVAQALKEYMDKYDEGQ